MNALELSELREWLFELRLAADNRSSRTGHSRAVATNETRAAERRAALLQKAITELKCTTTSTS